MHGVVVRRKFTFGESVGRTIGRRSSWGLLRGWWRMPYLPQTTSPFLIPLPPWNTRFLLPYLHSSHLLCHRPQFWMLLLRGVVSHQPSKLGPNRFIYLCYQVQASPLSHSGPLALKESQSSFQEAVWLVWWNTSCYYQPWFVFLRSRQKISCSRHLASAQHSHAYPWLSFACCLYDAFTSTDNFFNWPCEATLLQRKPQHRGGFSLCYFLA